MYVITTDATKLIEQLEVLDALDTTGQMKPTLKYSLDSSFAETIKKYASVNGITNVVADTSKPYIYTLSIDFENIDAINKALYLDKKDETMRNLYELKKGQLTRKDNDINFGGYLGAFVDFMGDMKYKIILNLPGKIKSTNNKNATVSEDKKSVTLTCELTDLMNKYASLGIDVNYK